MAARGAGLLLLAMLASAGGWGRAAAEALAPRPFPPGVVGTLLAAELAARSDGPAEAIEPYLEVARAHGEAAFAARAAALAYRARDEHRLAAATALWTELAPGSLEAWRRYAFALVLSDRTEEAVAVLRRIARQWDDPPGRGFDSVVAVLRLVPDTERRVDVMDQVAGDDAESRFALARVLMASNRSARASRVLEVLQRELPDDDRYAIAHATLLHGQGEVDAAIDLLDRHAARGDLGAAFLRIYARFLAAGDRGEDARARYEDLLERQPDAHQARLSLARLLARMESYREARHHLERLLPVPATRDAAWYYLGWIHESVEDPEAALKAYRRVRKGAYYARARIRAAVVLADSGRLRQARHQLEAMRHHADADGAHMYRVESNLLVQADQPHDAMELLSVALEAYPGDPDVLYARAMVAFEVDRLDLLERDLRAILEEDPEHADALNALGYSLADQTERYEEAHALIVRALELRPDESYIIDSMGWVLYRMGRYDEALAFLRRSHTLNPDPVVAAHLGEVLWVVGRREEARAVWNAALEKAPDDEVLVETMDRLEP